MAETAQANPFQNCRFNPYRSAPSCLYLYFPLLLIQLLDSLGPVSSKYLTALFFHLTIGGAMLGKLAVGVAMQGLRKIFRAPI